jgi:hypothetical protein
MLRIPSSGMRCCVDIVFNLQPPAHAGSSLADCYTLKMEAIHSSETSVHTTSTRRHIPEDGLLHSYGRENLRTILQLSEVFGKNVTRNFTSPIQMLCFCRLSFSGLLPLVNWLRGEHCECLRCAFFFIASSAWVQIQSLSRCKIYMYC